jgi:hypothetical protein
MNRNFIFASLAMAIAVNISIIGCHRKGDNESTIHPDSAKASVMNDSIQPAPDTLSNPYEKANLEIRTFNNEPQLGGFGYDVYLDQKLYVHQPHIPAIAGNRGFSTQENAKRTGEFVAYKIRHNIMPPSLSPKELDSLGVLK